ncbi:MAG: hypothetical protein GX802_03275 [Clostridiales bacterium]|nr:hypothetical protein [Clostridiales bacterium]
MKISAKDKQGTEAVFNFKLVTKDSTLFWALLIIGLLLLIALGIAALRYLLVGGYIDAKVTMVISDSNIQEIFDYSFPDPTIVMVSLMNRPKFTLYELCQHYYRRISVDEQTRAALNEVITNNRDILNICEFKRKPGTDRTIFIYLEKGQNPRVKTRRSGLEIKKPLKDGSNLIVRFK